MRADTTEKAERTEKKTYLDARSIHIFAWPFLFQEPGKKGDGKNAESFAEQLEKKGWMKKEMAFKGMERGSLESLKQTYMLEQYVSASAKKLFLQENHRDCVVYEYDLDPFGEGTSYYYRIRTEGKVYDLAFASIELHVYKYGIGILFLRTLNMDETTTLQDIRQINEKGRSIRISYIPEGRDGFMLCPDSLAIVAKTGTRVIENERIKTDFRRRIQRFYDLNTAEAREGLARKAEFLDYILNINLDGTGRNDLIVEPTSDYRMFVMSMIRDDVLSGQVKDKEWRESDEGEKELYSIFYVDSGDPSCQQDRMRRGLLEQSGYFRWADYGTVFGATNYSFVCIASKDRDINASVIRPFYAEYNYMVSLVLAQRIALMMFSEKAEELANAMFQKKKKHRLISRGNSKQLVDLQEMYIEYQNCMMILEFSCQEQGIELYHLLQKQLLIEREQTILNEQLKGLYEIVNISNGTRASWWSLVWAVLAVLFAILALF